LVKFVGTTSELVIIQNGISYSMKSFIGYGLHKIHNQPLFSGHTLTRQHFTHLVKQILPRSQILRLRQNVNLPHVQSLRMRKVQLLVMGSWSVLIANNLDPDLLKQITVSSLLITLRKVC